MDNSDVIRPKSRQPIPSDAKRVFEGKIFDVFQWEQTLFDGSKATFEKVKRLDSVNVFPVTSDGKIIITEQEQPGESPFLSAFGGRIERDEAPLDAAKRELMEEVGFVAKEWTLWKSVQPFSKIDWAIFSFVAKGIDKMSENKGDAGERIRLKYVTFDEFLEVVADPRYRDIEVSVAMFRILKDPEELQKLRTLFSIG